jgi:hypothetical protein
MHNLLHQIGTWHTLRPAGSSGAVSNAGKVKARKTLTRTRCNTPWYHKMARTSSASEIDKLPILVDNIQGT